MIDAIALRSQYEAARGQRDLLRMQQDKLQADAKRQSAEASLLQRCLDVCEKLSSSARERVAHVIGPVCSAALRDVFEPSYSLDIVHQQQPSGKYVTRLVASDGEVSGDPMRVRGGSVTNVLGVFLPASFALLRPDLVAPVFSLDEPLSGVSGHRLRSCAEAMYQLTHDPDRPLQIIITTQLTEVWDDLADVRIHVEKKNGKVIPNAKQLTHNPIPESTEEADL